MLICLSLRTILFTGMTGGSPSNPSHLRRNTSKIGPHLHALRPPDDNPRSSFWGHAFRQMFFCSYPEILKKKMTWVETQKWWRLNSWDFFWRAPKKKNMDSSCNLGVPTLRLFFCLLLVWQSCLRIGMVSMIWSLEIGFQPSFSRGAYPFEGNSNTAKIRGHFVDGFFFRKYCSKFRSFPSYNGPSFGTNPLSRATWPPGRPPSFRTTLFLGAPNPVRTTPESFLPGTKGFQLGDLWGQNLSTTTFIP